MAADNGNTRQLRREIEQLKQEYDQRIKPNFDSSAYILESLRSWGDLSIKGLSVGGVRT